MPTIAELDLRADEFVLRRTFDGVPDLVIEMERVVAHEEGTVLPFLWVATDDFDALDAALEGDPTVSDVRCLAEIDDYRLYRMEWIDHVEFLLRVLLEEGGTILNATGEDGQWSLRILFPEHASLSRTHDYCRDHGLTLTVERVYQLEATEYERFGLSEPQFAALEAAFDAGYYDVPRTVSLEGLAETLGVSHQSASERLRRGQRALIANTIKKDSQLEAKPV